MKTITQFLAFTVMLLVAQTLRAQADSTNGEQAVMDKITLRDGTHYVGTIEQDSEIVVIRLLNDVRIQIPAWQIVDRSKTEGMIRNGTFLRPDPNDSRTFFAPTARTIKQGKGFFSVYELFIPFLGFGITDDIMVAAGTPALPMLAFNYYYVGGKGRFINTPNLDVAAGFVYSRLFDEDGGMGLAYTVGTLGNQRSAVTLGYGTNFTEMDERVHMLMISGEVQSSNSIKFITENWIPLTGGSSMVSFGIRFFGENLAADCGLIIPTEQGGYTFVFLPWVGFAYNFGK